ncbi:MULTISPECIES: hypothetical protein [Rhizobiaceae]|jgi:hypothetical protein|uniref:Uncharacterized protein n=1 Tax=Aliirhizobium cellulosilyticum TaxID=393664 RepID=A0A7W6X9A1_9HYPH|nr:hypothetical protein [Rhizobium cellulosilyticum]MBB4348105.1 hypothetical protein [Rhizobium cellulosilyticum]MBB4411342.1 hypothetical protein [Rhizobium cellulosilyticum]MBB4446031.1 hypothetical protein [Rhizobium cellulosilyticum]
MMTIARRLTIVTLMMTIFALSFAALAVQPSKRPLGFNINTGSLCVYSNSGECVATL